jgi:hypothetical protein
MTDLSYRKNAIIVNHRLPISSGAWHGVWLIREKGAAQVIA